MEENTISRLKEIRERNREKAKKKQKCNKNKTNKQLLELNKQEKTNKQDYSFERAH